MSSPPTRTTDDTPASAPVRRALIASAIACTTALAATGAQSNCEPACGVAQLSAADGVTGKSQEPLAFARPNSVGAEMSPFTPSSAALVVSVL